ncbi:FHA domain-containing protein [Wenzhouxiangella marina]|uniref:Uncharacterized protein n=1 Tax=Wenzhouxiangella marina TaxID=1579979 RepID=A0A0K0XV98_9GAMM|nr:FHA domain-containing protein [Wenzhouxiangella marina]AKS41634.1 hypothetical protein WM2015_1260 [Wenzhouxiangella marina]MBB6086606.1 signal transduction histidine kinase [Wenzhouxiangella marina]
MNEKSVARLKQIQGPGLHFPGHARDSWLIGRGSDCDLVLADPQISRQHARIDWTNPPTIRDLGSSAGIMVNGQAVEQAELAAGDRLGIGPWCFVLAETSAWDEGRTVVVDARAASVAAPRLELLLDFSSRVNRVSSELEVQRFILETALLGSGFRRAALIDLRTSESTVLASLPDAPGSTDFSRQLIETARSRRLVELRQIPAGDRSASVAALEVSSALAVVEAVDDWGDLLLYLDTRQGEAREQPDTARFCQALLRVGSLALARLHHQQALWDQRERIYSDLHDDLGARLLNQIYRARTPADADEVRAMLQDLRDVVSRPAGQPQPLSELLAAVRSEAAERLENAGVELAWPPSDAIPDVDWNPADAANLSRAIREALSNGLRHAGASRFTVAIDAQAPDLHVRIAHDGDFQAPEDWSPGRGINGLIKRSLVLGGQVEWHVEGDQLITHFHIKLMGSTA